MRVWSAIGSARRLGAGEAAGGHGRRARGGGAAVVGVSFGLGYATGVLLSSLWVHFAPGALATTAVVGALVGSVVGSIARGARNRRRADATQPTPPWPPADDHAGDPPSMHAPT